MGCLFFQYSVSFVIPALVRDGSPAAAGRFAVTTLWHHMQVLTDGRPGSIALLAEK